MLAQFYWPDVGGEERHAQDLSEALAARGHDVVVATQSVDDLPAEETKNGVRIVRLHASMQRAAFLFSTTRTHASPFPDPELTAGLRRVAMAFKPDIVHAHNWIVHSYTPLKRQIGAKLLLSLHDHSHICPRKTLLRGDDVCDGPALVKCIACAREQYGLVKGAITVAGKRATEGAEHRAVDLFLPVSQDTAERDQLVKRGLPYRVIPNFLSNETLNFSSDTHHPALENLPDGDYILFAGDVRRFKGAHVLLEAYEGLTNAPPLVLVGRVIDQDLRFPRNVIPIGRVPHDAVTAARSRALFSVAPSIGAEPFGIVIIEAMAAGCPVIGSRIGGIPEIIQDGRNGLLVPPGDVIALRGAMQSLIDNPDDLQRMSTGARARAYDFTVDTVVSRVEAAYRDVLAGK